MILLSCSTLGSDVMKKLICLMLVLALLLLLGACADSAAPEKEDDTTLSSENSTPSSSENSAPSSSENSTSSYEEESQPPAPTPAPAPLHSELYLPDCSQQQMLDYFNEIVFSSEYGTGDSTLVRKWNIPIRYRIYGPTTQKDLEVLTDLFAELNKIDGFPGIYAADEGETENLTISFLGVEDFNLAFSDFLQGEDAYGATEYWYYNESNAVFSARIGYRTDVDQDTRVSILIEEIVNTLGLNDTEVREDSIVYQYSNDNTALSDIDWVILKMLYNPKIKSGMNADSCSDILKELYY